MNSDRDPITLTRLLTIVLIAGAGLAYFAALLRRPLVGDDLIYYGTYSNNYDGLTGLPLFMARNWLHVNARMGDMLSPVWLCLIPQWLRAAISGAAISGMLYASAALCSNNSRKDNPCIPFFTVALMLIILPWWDSTMLFAVQFNYVWASAAALLILLLILRRKMQSRFWLLLTPLSFVAGSMHEAIGFPLACGIICYLFTRAKQSHIDNISKKCNTAAFIFGGFFSITSPASYSRLVNTYGITPDDPAWLLYLKSDFLVLALVATLIILWFTHRHKLLQLARSPWVIFVVAAIASSIFSAVSGIVGRSGWFAQIFALIAIAELADTLKSNSKTTFLSDVVAVILTSALIVQLCAMAYFQRRCNNELEQVLESYKASDDGVVYCDVTIDSDKPLWLMHKTMSVPDADDLWVNHTIDHVYGNDDKQIRILPTVIRDLEILPEEKNVTVYVGDSFVTSEYPQESRTLPSGLTLCNRDGREFVILQYRKSGRTLYYLTPRDIDPGDR